MKQMFLFAATVAFMFVSGSAFAEEPEVAQPAASSEAAHHDHHGDADGHADHEHADHEHADHAHDEHGHGHIGDPATEPEVFDPQNWRTDLSIYSFVVFLILLTVLSKFAWGPVTEALDAREENIRKNIEDAEAARVRAEALLSERAAKLDAVQDEVREILAEARRDAEHTKSEILASAEREAELTRNRAEEEISRARDQALDEIFGKMSSQVAEATEHVIGRTLNDDDRNRLIDESLAQLSQS